LISIDLNSKLVINTSIVNDIKFADKKNKWLWST